MSDDLSKYTANGLTVLLAQLAQNTNVNSRYYEDVAEMHRVVRELDRRFQTVLNFPANYGASVN